MESASKGGVLKSRLQVLHIPILLVAPLGTGSMAQPGTDQHESGIAVWETTCHTGAAADLPVQPFHDVVGADTRPVFAGEITVASIWQWTGFNVLMYYAGLQNISGDIYEAARVDGAGYWQTVFHITIPQLRPVVTMSILWNLIGGFKVYDLVAVMTAAGPNYATEVIATYTYRHAFELNKMGTASVAAIVIVVLCVVASIIRMKASEE